MSKKSKVKPTAEQQAILDKLATLPEEQQEKLRSEYVDWKNKNWSMLQNEHKTKNKKILNSKKFCIVMTYAFFILALFIGTLYFLNCLYQSEIVGHWKIEHICCLGGIAILFLTVATILHFILKRNLKKILFTHECKFYSKKFPEGVVKTTELDLVQTYNRDQSNDLSIYESVELTYEQKNDLEKYVNQIVNESRQEAWFVTLASLFYLLCVALMFLPHFTISGILPQNAQSIEDLTATRNVSLLTFLLSAIRHSGDTQPLPSTGNTQPLPNGATTILIPILGLWLIIKGTVQYLPLFIKNVIKLCKVYSPKFRKELYETKFEILEYENELNKNKGAAVVIDNIYSILITLLIYVGGFTMVVVGSQRIFSAISVSCEPYWSVLLILCLLLIAGSILLICVIIKQEIFWSKMKYYEKTFKEIKTKQ